MKEGYNKMPRQKRSKCIACKKPLKSFDYWTVARIKGNIDNSYVNHCCSEKCFVKHTKEIITKFSLTEGGL